MVGDIGQPTHLHYDMFYFYASGFLLIGVCFHYFTMLMVRYYRYYTIVTYDICVMASVGR